jgi:hypothetical protein
VRDPDAALVSTEFPAMRLDQVADRAQQPIRAVLRSPVRRVPGDPGLQREFLIPQLDDAGLDRQGDGCAT